MPRPFTEECISEEGFEKINREKLATAIAIFKVRCADWTTTRNNRQSMEVLREMYLHTHTLIHELKDLGYKESVKAIIGLGVPPEPTTTWLDDINNILDAIQMQANIITQTMSDDRRDERLIRQFDRDNPGARPLAKLTNPTPCIDITLAMTDIELWLEKERALSSYQPTDDTLAFIFLLGRLKSLSGFANNRLEDVDVDFLLKNSRIVLNQRINRELKLLRKYLEVYIQDELSSADSNAIERKVRKQLAHAKSFDELSSHQQAAATFAATMVSGLTPEVVLRDTIETLKNRQLE